MSHYYFLSSQLSAPAATRTQFGRRRQADAGGEVILGTLLNGLSFRWQLSKE